jgi:Ax21 family sulfation-dependent quorum factor
MNKTILAAALLAATSFSAQASDKLSYSFVEADYIQSNVDDQDVEGININPTLVGWGLKGSFAVADKFYVFGGYSSGKDDILAVDEIDFTAELDASVDRWNLGFGFHTPISSKTDFVAELGYVQYDYKFDFDVNDDGDQYSESYKVDAGGARLSGGLRSALTDNFEAYGMLNFTDSQDIEGDFSGNIGGQFKFNATWGLTGDVEFAKDAINYTFGVRASF